MADRTGQLLGNYRLDKLLGHGSFAEVYRGQHIHLNTPAAIKILFATELNSPGSREVFLLEARTIAELAHPHIVEVKDFSIDQNIPFLVMEYTPKGSLLNNYPSGSQLFLPTILAYVEQIASALQYAHEHKKIHRDVKPANILVRNNGSVMLGDFGIATIAHNTSSRQTVDISGTYAYMAPEQMNGHPCPASDQYALAIMVYEWIAGCLPFYGTMTELIAQHTTAHPPSLVILVPTLPQAVEQVIFRALAKDPKDRFASVQEFAQALRSAAQIGGTRQQQPVSPAQTFADFIAATSPARPTDEANQRTPFPSMPITEPQTKPPAHQTFYSDITSPEMVHSANHKPFASREASIRTSDIASMQDLLYLMDEALADEIQAKRDDQKNVKHTAIDGELVFEANQRFIYAFHLDGIWEPEDETPMIIEFSDPALQSIKCTIVNATGNAITIATDSTLPAEALQKIWLVDDSAALLERLRERLQHSDEGKALLGSKSFGFLPYPIRSSAPTVAFGKEFLPDASQQRAINQAFGSEVTYIIGPPGTGKTYALAAIAFAQFCAGRTVLIAANTNIAVDNAIMRVAKICRDSQDANASRALSMGQILRYGTPQLEDQLKENYKEIHLPSIVKQRSRQLNQEQEEMRDQLRGLMHQQEVLEKAQLQQRTSYPAPGGNSTFTPAESTYEQSKNLLTRLFTKGPTPKPPQRPVDYAGQLQHTRSEIESVQVRLAEIEAQIADIEMQIVADARIVATTLAKTYMNSTLFERRFDVIILDEASMALPPAVYLAASHADASVTIIGDPQQLKPIVVAETEKAKAFLEKDIFTLRGISISVASSGLNSSVLLTEQARMHPHIANIASRHVYRGQLENSARILDDAKWQQYEKIQPLPGQPLILCDTSDSFPQAEKPQGKSLVNEYHANCCFALAQRVLATLPERVLQKGEFRIGLVTPYAKQARKLQRMVKNAGLINVIRAGTVHRFQGLEAEVIIFDTVASPPLKPSDFIGGVWGSDAMRLVNVAITRAQSKLIVVANYPYLQAHLLPDATLRHIIEEAHDAGYLPSANLPGLEEPSFQSSSMLNSVPHSGTISQGRGNSSRQSAQKIEMPKQWGDDIHLYRNDFPEESTITCKNCGSALVLRKNGTTNKPFYSCPKRHRNDRNHSSANLTERDFITALKSLEDLNNMTCSQCRKPVTVGLSGDNAWIQCSDMQSCGYGRRIIHH